jgi:uncharacterized membrane protein (DUF4010 family)
MFDTPFSQAMLGMLIAVAAGAVIGIEREQAHNGAAEGFGGVRTYPAICLAGALSGLLAQSLGPWIVVAGILVIGALLAISHYQEIETRQGFGITSEIAAVVTYFLGVLATLPVSELEVHHRLLLVPAIAGGMMSLLSVKEPLHDVVRKLSLDDMYAAAKFILLALIVLPLLPNEGFGPFQSINPFKIGLMVALIAGISFVGYFATRFVSADRALLVTGALGGLASSTAVTVSVAGRVRESEKALYPALAAVVAAGGSMFVRVIVVIAVMDARLLPSLAPPFVAMAVVSAVIAVIAYRYSRNTLHDGKDLKLHNPFELRSALTVGLIITVVLLITRWANHAFGARGFYATAALTGIADVDGILLSAATMHRDGLQAEIATAAVAIAAMVNTFSKVGMATWLGGRGLGWRLLLAAIAVITAGVVALIIG